MPENSPPPGNPGEWRQGGPPGWHYHHGRYGSSWSASLHQLGSSFGGQLIVIALIAVVAVAAALALRRRPDWTFGLRAVGLRAVGLNTAASCLALGSLATIAVSTLTPRSNAYSAGQLQLVPLHTVISYLDRPADLLIYLGGNIALFMPLGFFSCLAVGLSEVSRVNRPTPVNRRRLLRWVIASTLASTLVSVCVEILQLPIWSRSTDVDDVLTNAVGGLLGGLAGAGVLYLIGIRAGKRAAPPAYAVGSLAS